MKIGKYIIKINITCERDFMENVKAELLAGHRLGAIKMYCDATGSKLLASKKAVDKLLPKYYRPTW